MKGYRTLLFSILTALLGVLEAFDWTNVITGESAPVIIIALGALFAFLRKITTTPLGNAGEASDSSDGV